MEKLNIYQKLLSIQEKVKGLGKDKQAMTYKYTTGDKVLDHLRPLWTEAGLLLKQEILSIENTRQDYTVGGNTPRPKSEILSKVMMKFTWVDAATGDKDENLFGANGQNDWDKGIGSALTYAERYFLLKYFHIATDEDDIDNPGRKPADEPTQPKIVPEPTTAEKVSMMNGKQPEGEVTDAHRKAIGMAQTIPALNSIVKDPACAHLISNEEFKSLVTKRRAELTPKV
jgi:hypothetical protein